MHHRDEDLPARSDAVGLVLELVRPQLEERLEQQDHHHLFFLFTKCRLCVFFSGLWIRNRIRIHFPSWIRIQAGKDLRTKQKNARKLVAILILF